METISVDFVWSGDETYFLREPAPYAHEKQKKAIILPCKALLGLDLEALKIGVHASIHTGCEILAVVGPRWHTGP